MRTRQNVNLYFIYIFQIRKDIFEKTKENRNFSLDNGERGFGKEIKDLDNKKAISKNIHNEKIINFKVYI